MRAVQSLQGFQVSAEELDPEEPEEEPELVELTLDAWARAEEGRRRGMAEVELHAGEPWNLYARRWVVAWLCGHEELVGPELWGHGLERPPNTLRALGPVLAWAARAGLMERTGRTTPSVLSHLSPAWVWRSLVFGRRPEDVTPPG